MALAPDPATRAVSDATSSRRESRRDSNASISESMVGMSERLPLPCSASAGSNEDVAAVSLDEEASGKREQPAADHQERRCGNGARLTNQRGRHERRRPAEDREA